MNVSVGKRWEEFIDALVKSGRYASATEVMREGLRLVEEREAKFKSLRETIEASLAEDGETDRRSSARICEPIRNGRPRPVNAQADLSKASADLDDIFDYLAEHFATARAANSSTILAQSRKSPAARRRRTSEDNCCRGCAASFPSYLIFCLTKTRLVIVNVLHCGATRPPRSDGDPLQ